MSWSTETDAQDVYCYFSSASERREVVVNYVLSLHLRALPNDQLNAMECIQMQTSNSSSRLTPQNKEHLLVFCVARVA